MPIISDPPDLDFLPDGCTPDDVQIYVSDQRKRVHVINYDGIELAYVEEWSDRPQDLHATDLFLCLTAFDATQNRPYGHA